MITEHKFTINEFAEFARTTRAALRHYEEIGLLVPISRSCGNYRQYTYSQLATANLIHTCQALGMPLGEIQDLIEKRTPALIKKLLEKQINQIDLTVENWLQSRKLLCVLDQTIQSALNVDESEIKIQFFDKKAITLGGQNDYSSNRDDYDALHTFYQSCHKKYPSMDMNLPVWGKFSQERIKHRDWHWADWYYFNDPDGPDERPSALYAVGYKRGGYGQAADLYERMLDYIETRRFVVSGPAYEEYPLNEICVADDMNYLIRILITVEQLK